MKTYLVTARRSLADEVNAGLRTKGVHHTEVRPVLEAIVGNGHSSRTLIVLDLATIPDAAHFITFVKSSAGVSSIPIVGIGRREDYDALEPGALAGLAGLLHLPCTAGEIAAMEARVFDVAVAKTEIARDS